MQNKISLSMLNRCLQNEFIDFCIMAKYFDFLLNIGMPKDVQHSCLNSLDLSNVIDLKEVQFFVLQYRLR